MLCEDTFLFAILIIHLAKELWMVYSAHPPERQAGRFGMATFRETHWVAGTLVSLRDSPQSSWGLQLISTHSRIIKNVRDGTGLYPRNRHPPRGGSTF